MSCWHHRSVGSPSVVRVACMRVAFMLLAASVRCVASNSLVVDSTIN